MDVPPAAILFVTADTGRTPRRGPDRRQPFDAGQRHGHCQCRRQCPPAAGRARRRRNGGWTSPR
ncbi:MAG: hypothetical protein WDN24_20830 [Sphingomonas sp.]